MLMYCLTHEEWIDDWHWTVRSNCSLVASMPPEFDMSYEWVDSLPVPDEDELILIDMNAEVLEADFIGV